MITNGEQNFGLSSIIGGRFQVQRPLGAGGMGWVVAVNDLQIAGSLIAAKILYPHLLTNEVALDRFRNEILIARRLTHSNIVRVYGFHSMSELHLITMEYLESQHLADWYPSCANTEQNRETKYWIVKQILRALAYSHSQGVTHRDIKPQNILILKDNSIRVVDFGISHIAQQQISLTKTNHVVGTPQYMAPEQFMASQLSNRTDLYAVGVLAYWLLNGRTPFSGLSYFALADQHLTAPIPPMLEEIPSLWRKIIETCLQKSPEKRFGSAQEILALLGDEESRYTPSLNSENDFYSKPEFEEASNRLTRFWRGQSLPKKIGMALVVIVAMIYGLLFWSQYNGYIRRIIALRVMKIEYKTGIPLPFLHPWLRILSEAPTQEELRRLLFESDESTNQLSLILTVEHLIRAGVDPNVYDQKTGISLLQHSIRVGLKQLSKLALEHGANPNVASGGVTAICEAVLNFGDELILELLNKGANPNLPCHQGRSLMHTAFDYSLGNPNKTVRLLAEKGININSQDTDGNTPLHYAVMRGTPDIAETLLSFDADQNILNFKGLKAVDYLDNGVLSDSSREILKKLLKPR